MARRPVRSVTIYDGAPVPSWARYTVLVCCIRAGIRTPTQAFSSRRAAESWARTVASEIPTARTDDNPCNGPQWWILVCALDAGRYLAGSRFIERGRHCYLAIDPGGVVVKNHPILSGYGVTTGAA